MLAADHKRTFADPPAKLLPLQGQQLLSDFEQGEISPDPFRQACLMGLEGMVSNHRESAYRGGRFRHWIKIKNWEHPAYGRVQTNSSRNDRKRSA
jgi:hypothetical protein